MHPRYRGAMDERLCLLAVHAHPDDESSKGAATVAKLHDEGVHTVLVCCTGGEEGDVLNPAMDTPEVRENLATVRAAELAAATAAIGYDEVVLLGYRDSGMPDSPANANPASFAQAPAAEAVGKLVAVIRRVRPQVLLTYNEDQRGYPHPDHLRVHDVSVAAFEAAADPDAYPGLGEPYQVRKLYYNVWSAGRMRAFHERFLALGLESPFTEERLARAGQEPTATTVIDVTGYEGRRRAALAAHATQIDPTSPFWFGLPEAEAEAAWHTEEWQLARSLVGDTVPEDDLFAGLRASAGRH